MRNNEKKERESTGAPQRRPQEGRSQQGGADYWDSIADDVASGYGAQRRGRDRSLLNPDQEPDDAQRGDR